MDKRSPYGEQSSKEFTEVIIRNITPGHERDYDDWLRRFMISETQFPGYLGTTVIDPKYAGYVAWRGVVDENKVPIDVIQFFANKFTFFHGRNTQILCYLIPGPTGELSEGKRRLNWVWYVNVSAGNKLQSLLTDRYGKQREFSWKEKRLPIKPQLFDVTHPLPFPDRYFDAAYSHMLFNMRFSLEDLHFIFSEINRVPKTKGFNFFSARNQNDNSYGRGTEIEKGIYDINGFQIRFFTEKEVLDLTTTELYALPKHRSCCRIIVAYSHILSLYAE